MRFLIVGVFLSLIPFFAAAQRTKDVSSETATPSSLDPGTSEQKTTSSPKARRSRKSNGPVVETQAEYEARMKRTAKEIRKREKEMKKPQYSDPLYFGHKRPPRKNKAGHLKYCKECGIRH